MKAPFYVVDRTRNLVFGQFFKQASADEVAAILKHHSINGDSYIEMFGTDHWRHEYLADDLKRGDLHKGTETDLTKIAAEKYLTRKSRNAMSVGHVIQGQGQQMVVVRLDTSGRKWETWTLRGLSDGRQWTRKIQVGTDRSVFIRMATPNELHGARTLVAQRDARVQQRVDTSREAIKVQDIRVGDVVTIGYGNGNKDEVVEDINYKTGRIAIARRGASALMHEKRRFLDAKHVVKIVEKGPGHFKRNNPMYAKYGVTSASTADYERANAAKTDPLSSLVRYLNIR